VVTLELEAPLEVARWRPLVHWLLAVPHYVVLYFLRIVSGALTVLSFFTILFTGQIPEAIFDFLVMILRYQWRVSSYVGFLREPYAPFEFTLATVDPGTDPARLSIERPERLSRVLIFFKWFLAIPHYIVLIFVGIAAVFAWLAAFVVVLVTGRWPDGLRRFVVGVSRWITRVYAYVGLLTDEYPPFSLS